MDRFHGTNPAQRTLLDRFADVSYAAACITDWEAIDKKARVLAVTTVHVPSCTVWSRLPPLCLARTLDRWGMSSWDASEARLLQQGTFRETWSREDDGKITRNMANSALLLNIQLLRVVRLPHTVHATAAKEFLPDTGAISVRSYERLIFLTIRSS